MVKKGKNNKKLGLSVWVCVGLWLIIESGKNMTIITRNKKLY